MSMFGGVEIGGTKTICAVGSGPGDLQRTRIETTTPAETLGAAADWLAAGGSLDAIGIASFGPLDLNTSSPGFGHFAATPKPGWSGADLLGVFRPLGPPVMLDTDVNGALLGEWRWGAARGRSTAVYVTVGTGIGGGALVDGHLHHGVSHPEMGHVPVPRHPEDPYPGDCPFHGGCLEGMAAGPAIAARWGRPADDLGNRLDAAVEIEAHYLANGLAAIVAILDPEVIVVGGGVAKMPGLMGAVRLRLRALLAGYRDRPEHAEEIDRFVVTPGLGDDAGVLGAIALAERAVR